MYDTSDVKEESKKIKSLYSDFKSKLQQFRITLSNNLQSAITAEDTLLGYAILYIDLDDQIGPLINNYIESNGRADADTLATQVVPSRSDNNFYNDIGEILIKYIASKLEIYAFYNDNYCFTDGKVTSRLWSELETNTAAIQKGLDE